MRITELAEILLRTGDCAFSIEPREMIGAMFNMMNRIMDGYGITNTAEFRLSRGRVLAESGYLPPSNAGGD